jgi:inhibitor of KinA
MFKKKPMQIEALGDAAALVTLADEAAVTRFVAAVREHPAPWLVDVVPAYVTAAVYFDLEAADYETVAAALAELRLSGEPPPGSLHVIPCCYEYGRDLERVAGLKQLKPEEVIRLHTGTVYTVYAIGFCPGFPYLGYLPAQLTGVPRLEQPRLRVEPGSVGLTGRQTGIYPLPRPGGWNLIGQTPLELVNVEDGYFPLRAGDQVRFQPIDAEEFRRRKGERLES